MSSYLPSFIVSIQISLSGKKCLRRPGRGQINPEILMGSSSASLRIRNACCSLPLPEKSQSLYIRLTSSASQYGIVKCLPSLSPNQVLPEPGKPIIKIFMSKPSLLHDKMCWLTPLDRICLAHLSTTPTILILYCPRMVALCVSVLHQNRLTD